MMKFELDLSPLRDAIKSAPELAGKGATQALKEIKDDWVSGARDIAPLSPFEGGNLRRQIKGKLEDEGLEGSIMVTGNAIQRTGTKWPRFNYGYYIHELGEDKGLELRTPGTVHKFLDESVDEDKWQGVLEDRVKSRLKRKGWD